MQPVGFRQMTAATSFLFYMSPPSKFCICLPARHPPPSFCVCAGFVFMTNPVIHRRCRAADVNTAEVHYTVCCSCPLPGSRLSLQSDRHFFFFFWFCFVFVGVMCVCGGVSLRKQTYTVCEPEFIVIMTSIKLKMLSLKSLCQIVHHKRRVRSLLVQRWFVRDKHRCDSEITVVEMNWHYFNYET